MSATKVPYGRPVKLLVDYQGFPDGRLVQFEIWRRKGQKEEKVSEVYGVTKEGKGVGRWIPRIERKEVLPLEEKISQLVEEEKYYFIAKIDNKEVKSGDIIFTYPLDIYLEDEDGDPLDGAKYTVTFSDGSKEKGVFENGHARFTDAPPGKFTIELEEYEFIFGPLGTIIEARWEKSRAKCGEKVKMIVEVEDFEDGTPAKFEIWERDIDGKNNLIKRIDGKVQGNKVEAVWVYSPGEVEEDLKEEVTEEEGEPEYFFAVDIEGDEARSGVLTFTYPLDIYLEDEDGKKLDDVKYTVTFSDGTEREGKFKDGQAKIEDAPYGRFILKVEGYYIIFKKP